MSLWRDDEGRVRAAWRVLLGIFVVVICELLAGTAAMMTAGTHPRLFDAVYQPLAMVLVIVGFSALLMTADDVAGSTLPAMGLRRACAWREAWLGILLGSGMVALAAAVIAVSGNFRSLSGRFDRHTALLAALEIFILAAGAMKEELMFRGYPFQRLVEAVGPAGAIILLSILFGAVHLGNPHAKLLGWGFLNTIAIGVFLSLAYLRTRALWLPWGIHFGWNATLGVVFGLPVSGITDFAVVVRGKVSGPAWLVGGGYGLEASALGTAVILLGFVIFLNAFPAAQGPSGPPETLAQERPERPRDCSAGIQL